MPRPERPIDPLGPIADFAIGLRALRHRANLSYRQMADMTHYCISVLATAASGELLPTWAVTAAYVRACGDLPEHWHERWELAAMAWEAASHAST